MTWSTLIEQYNSVPTTHELRPGEEDILQYLNGEHEFLAIKDQKPYGALDVTVGETEPEVFCFTPVEQNQEYTTFILPEETIALRAAIFGTNYRNSAQLVSVFHNIGGAVSELSRQVEVPDLTLDDFAISRRTGQLYVVPPVHFKPLMVESEKDAEQALVHSFSQALRFWTPESREELLSNIASGFEDERK